MINSKINDIIIYKYNFNYNNKEKKSIEFKYLENLFASFNKDFKPLFDTNIFSLEFRISLFKLIILSNYRFIKKNEIYNKKFIDKFERYILIFKLKEKDKELLDEYNNILKKSKEEIEKELTDFTKDIKSELFKTNENTNKNNVIIVHDGNNQELKSLNKKYLKLIFGLSMMFNNIISVIKKNNQEGIEEISYKLNNKIKCSSIERQFLLNILSIFKEEKSLIYNYLLESNIYEEATSKYNRHLYHKIIEGDKINIPYNSIINGMMAKYNDDKDKEKENKEKEKKDNKINETKPKISEDQKKFINEFTNFYNNYKVIFEQKEVKKGFLSSIFWQKKPVYVDTNAGKMVN
jgi:aarF domain-containing kinase